MRILMAQCTAAAVFHASIWLPGHEKNRCRMVYMFATPTNLSDPFLANWTQPRSFVWPEQGVQPHPRGVHE